MTDKRWTPLIGLRNAGVMVLVRTPVATAGYVICLLVASQVLNFLTISMSIFAMIAVIAIVPGVAIGYGLTKGLTERAGFTGLVLGTIPVVGSIVSVVCGANLATLITPIGDWQLGFASIATAVWASLWSLKTVVFE